MIMTLKYLSLVLAASANEKTSKGPAKSNTSTSLKSNMPTVRIVVMGCPWVNIIKLDIAHLYPYNQA